MKFTSFIRSASLILLAITLSFFTPVVIKAQEGVPFKITSFNEQELPDIHTNELWTEDSTISFKGTHTPNASLNVQIGDQKYAVPVSSEGVWQISESFEVGDYNVLISTESDTFGYLVRIGQEKPAESVNNGSESEVPTTQKDLRFNRLIKYVVYSLGAILLLMFILAVFKRRGSKQEGDTNL